MNESNCSFCADLQNLKDTSEYWDRKNPRPLNSWTEWHISIIQLDYWKGQHNGTLSGQLHPLRFCPECGKRLS